MAAGRMSPTALASSTPPMRRTVPAEKSAVHGSLGSSLSLGWVDFTTSATANVAARTACRIRRDRSHSSG